MNKVKQEIGVIRSLYRYPVKSMAGVSLLTATLGWHGFAGDRHFALQFLKQLCRPIKIAQVFMARLFAVAQSLSVKKVFLLDV